MGNQVGRTFLRQNSQANINENGPVNDEPVENNNRRRFTFPPRVLVGNNNRPVEEGNLQHPRAWSLFGGGVQQARADFAFLANLQGANRNFAPSVQQTQTIKCPVNLQKNSLQLIPVKKDGENSNSRLYRVSFMFDASTSGSIQIHYAVTELVSADSKVPQFQPETSRRPIRFERGLGQVFEQPEEDYLDVSQYKEEDLVYNAENSYYPIVIVIQADDVPKGKDKDETKVVSSQTTFGALIHCADDSYAVKPIKQKIRCEGKSYVVHEIFGLENGEVEGGRDCVICLAEPRDTTALPCRHMCLCSGCAEVLRHQSNKCPICRSTMKSMVQIKVRQGESEVTYEDAEEDPLVLKKLNTLTVES